MKILSQNKYNDLIVKTFWEYINQHINQPTYDNKSFTYYLKKIDSSMECINISTNINSKFEIVWVIDFMEKGRKRRINIHENSQPKPI